MNLLIRKSVNQNQEKTNTHSELNLTMKIKKVDNRIKQNFVDIGIITLIIFILSSCVSYQRTDSGGIRTKSSKVYKYNKPKYRDIDFSQIDTNAIYLLDTLYNKYDKKEPIKQIDGSACRFFSGGQVLFFHHYDSLSVDLINDKNAGTPGYFVVQEDKLKVDMFQNLNGGQTGKYFGYIRVNGDIVFYEQRPETYQGIFSIFHGGVYSGLEQYGKKTVWIKSKIDGLLNYKPDW